MFNWIFKTFFRQMLVLLLLGGLAISVVFGFLDYQKERQQLQSVMQTNAELLAKSLSLLVADDVRYRHHFELWNRINAIFEYSQQKQRDTTLFHIREIAVLNPGQLVIAHTTPKEHRLLMPYQHPLISELQDVAGSAIAARWFGQPQPTLLLRYPITFGNEQVGFLVLDLDPSPLNELQQALAETYLLYGLLLSFMLTLAAIAASRWFSKPIEQACESLPELGSGQLSLPALNARHDEFQQLAGAIEDADQRIHQATLAQQNRQEELERRVKERTQEIEAFSYSVSHDLRAPLRALDGFSLALYEDYAEQLDETAVDYLHRIRSAAGRMGQLIDDLLMLSRVTRQSMQLEPVDLSQMATEILAELREAYPERQVSAVIGEGISAKGDPRLLRIVLDNLIGNAWKYSANQPQAQIEFSAERRPDDKTIYCLRDNGIGFDMKYSNKLFQAFQRLHGHEFEGTGIGLVTVQRIISRHGGRIWAKAAIGQGASFYFELPNQPSLDF